MFGEAVCELAEEDERICAITAAMKSGTCLQDFAARFPERFFDVGIAEEHAVTFASGLARGGRLPVFAVYSTFLQRSYDQLLNEGLQANWREYCKGTVTEDEAMSNFYKYINEKYPTIVTP